MTVLSSISGLYEVSPTFMTKEMTATLNDS